MSPLLWAIVLEVALVIGWQAVGAVGPALISAGRRCQLVARQIATFLSALPVLLEIGVTTTSAVFGLIVAAIVVRQRIRWIGRHQ